MAEIKPSILIVDDELSVRESFSLILGKEFNVATAASGEAALKKIIDERIDLVYLDIRMPGMNGIEALKRIKEIDPAIEIIMVTAVNEVGSAGTAIKLGAKDYIVKPFDIKDILNKTRNIIIKAQTKTIKSPGKEELIGSSRQITNIKRSLEQILKKETNVLITGEKGSEAEKIANILSGESERSLHALNVSVHFKSSALFGCEKGVFTDAFKKESGILEEANGGILFIRNIELLPNDVQSGLARSLSKKEISREGSLSATPVDIRIIAETSVNLKEMAKEGLFDEDLYNIISQATIELPPLRQREGDVPILINHCIEGLSGRYNREVKVSGEAMEILTGYPWPGNLAELSNTVEAIILSLDHDEISPDDLPLDILIKSPAGGRFISLEHMEDKLEKAHILDVYNKTGRNKEKTAALLGIPQKALESKLELVHLIK